MRNNYRQALNNIAVQTAHLSDLMQALKIKNDVDLLGFYNDEKLYHKNVKTISEEDRMRMDYVATLKKLAENQ